MGNALTKTEQKNLTRCEKVIGTGLTTFFAVGQALWDIRDAKLYRGSHDTFEAYCDERWDFSRSRAYQLITAAEVTADLSTIVDIPPERESHVRPLLVVPGEHRGDVWKRVVATAPQDGTGKPRISARHIEATVAAWQWEQREDEPEATSEPVDEPIDVESRPITPPVQPPECPECKATEWGEDEEGYFCLNCKAPLGTPLDCSVDNESESEPSPDDLFLSSIEEAVRTQFDGRLAVAAVRLETMADTLRSEI